MRLYYDPDCGICTQAGHWLAQQEVGADILPAWSDEEFSSKVDPQRFSRAIPLVTDDGHTTYGVIAVGLVLKTSQRRSLQLLGRYLLSPIGRLPAEKVYALIAENRWRLPGSTCSLPRRS
ncbi:thiol-disulfide oxidoreductase DCC family protein [Rothia sp. P7181]|uniref:thiol-disulfide oxidoreductase DCC family protein n=1 Tax=Rothia sp. P7181 TaxID=3402663 RepID=UPI003AED6177